MTRGDRVRRGVVVLGLVITGAAGCAGGGAEGERVMQAAPPAARSAVAGAASTRPEAGPTRSTEVINFPVGSWRRLPPSPPMRVEIPSIGVSSPLVRLGLNRDRSRFEVDSVASYPKEALPTEAVYGATTAPVPRLIPAPAASTGRAAATVTTWSSRQPVFPTARGWPGE